MATKHTYDEKYTNLGDDGYTGYTVDREAEYWRERHGRDQIPWGRERRELLITTADGHGVTIDPSQSLGEIEAQFWTEVTDLGDAPPTTSAWTSGDAWSSAKTWRGIAN